MSMQPGLYSLSGLAVEFRCDRRTIAKLLIDLPADDANGKGKRWRILRVLRHPPVVEAFGLHTNGNGEELDLNQERARLARAQSEKTELEVAKIRGELLDAETTRKAISRLVGDFRTRLLAMPTKWAPRLAGLAVAQIKEELERGIYEALDRFAHGEPTQYLTELGTSGAAAPEKTERQPVGRRKPRAKPRKRSRARKMANR